MRIALVQYRVGADRAANIKRGLAAVREAAANRAKLVAGLLGYADGFEPGHSQTPNPDFRVPNPRTSVAD